MPISIQGNRPNGVVTSKSEIALASGGFGFSFFKALEFAVDHKFSVVDQLDTEASREVFSSFAYKVHMWTFTQDETRRADGISNTLHAAHTAGAQSGAIHNERVHLHLAVGRKKAATSGIECRVIFHDHHSFLDGFECRTSGVEHLPANSKGIEDTATMVVDHVCRNRPSSAMNYENGISSHASPEEQGITSKHGLSTVRYRERY